MDKRAVESYMHIADEVINELLADEINANKIRKKNEENEENEDKNELEKIQDKLSAFGATVIMSGRGSALAYYEKKDVKVKKLLEKMYENDTDKKSEIDGLFEFDKKENEEELKELIINYAISLKLVLNLYI